MFPEASKKLIILTLQLVVNTPSAVRKDNSVALLSESRLHSASIALAFTVTPRSFSLAATAFSTTGLLKQEG